MMPSDDSASDVVWSDRHESCRCWFFFRDATAPSGPRPPLYQGHTITLSQTHHTR